MRRTAPMVLILTRLATTISSKSAAELSTLLTLVESSMLQE
jgi:hypothetical protein